MLAGALSAGAQDAPLKNWFNDPFFALSRDMEQCPVPRGPFMTEAEMKAESHSRIERGTTCWMTGRCKEPNAYLYDTGIGEAIRVQLKDDSLPHGSSLWVTVKRRFVWLEGCVADPASVAALEAKLKEAPDVERVLVNVMHGTDGKPPYPLRDAAGQK